MNRFLIPMWGAVVLCGSLTATLNRPAAKADGGAR
jgi:hypothetical protein